MNVINIPQGFTADETARLKAVNPGAGFLTILPMQPGEAAITEADGQTVALWITLAKQILGGAGTLLVPGPWAPLVGGIIAGGIDLIASAVAKKPPTERWTLAMLKAEEATIASPLT